MTVRVLIADDELLARSRIRDMLKHHHDIDIVGECGNCEEVYTAVVHHRPDVLLLDIEMPGCNGFDVLKRLPEDVNPVIVFITAHMDFALDAFDTSAADYVLKPFDQTRFDRAIDRARRMVGSQKKTPPVARGGKERFAVRRRGEIVFVKTADIDWIAAEGNYARLHAAGRSYLIRDSLQNLEESLDGATFIRVHRSAIANIDRVEKIVSTRDGGNVLVLSTGESVPLGPAYREKLQELLGDA